MRAFKSMQSLAMQKGHRLNKKSLVKERWVVGKMKPLKKLTNILKIIRDCDKSGCSSNGVVGLKMSKNNSQKTVELFLYRFLLA